MIRLTLTGLALSLCALSLAACNTIHGLGRDIQAVGKTIAETAQDGQPKHRTNTAQSTSQSTAQTSRTATTTSPPARTTTTSPPARPRS